jgi:exopolysaccharide production protein ExoZ
MIDKKYSLIQILRGFAAVFVMLYHATRHYNLKNDVFLNNFFKTGFLGVDIFFVLSGFVISISSFHYFNNQDSIGFIKKRFIRIYPSYWLFLLFPLTLVFLFFPNFISDKTAFEPQNFISLLVLFFNHPTISQVTWTLSFELYFYLLFFLLIINKNFKYVIFLVLILSFINFLGFINFHLILLKYLFSPLILEFFLGVLLAYIVLKTTKINKTICAFLFILSLGLFYFSSYLSHCNLIQISKHNRFLYFGIASFLLILALVLYEKFYSVKLYEKLILIGDSSYVLYLIHSVLLSFFDKLILENRLVLLSKSFSTMLVCILIIFISVLLHVFIEKPILVKLSYFFNKKRINHESL